MKTDPYPEHTRLSAIHDKSQAIGEFLEWLGDNGYSICEFQEARSIDHPDATDGFYPLHRSIQSWLAQYFQIDPAKIEREKRQMLDEIRALNDDADAT